jgi:predicted amino acid dehydrogenase
MKFAFVIHPLKAKELAAKYPVARFLPDRVIEAIMAKKHPQVVSHITGIQSITGAITEGWFIGCPYTPNLMLRKLPLEQVYDRIAECATIAHDLGASIIGLGAFTSVVGDGGITVAKRSSIAVTTGNSYTVATAIDGALKACDEVGIQPGSSILAVVGATGSIGRTCALILGPRFKKTLLIGRDLQRTQEVADEVERATATTSFSALKEADLVVTVTSSDTAIIEPEHLKSGAVVCDVARPRDVSKKVIEQRPDVLVIEGGVVAVPGNVDFGFDFGFPQKTAFACMSETMILALENRAENFTLGKTVSVEQVQEIQRLATKHGFELAGFRAFEHAVAQEGIERIRQLRKTPGAVVLRSKEGSGKPHSVWSCGCPKR